MSRQTRFLKKCLKHGISATITIKTGGTVCPCMTYRDPNNPQYSEEYHRAYPAAEDCGGDGVIGETNSSVTVKGFIYPVDVIGMTTLPEMIKLQIGEKPEADALWYGSVNTSDNSFYTLSALVERKNTMTVNSVVYLVRDVFSLVIDSTVGEVCLLKRKS